MKRCSKCKRTLPEAAFSRDRSNSDGLQNHCRECRKSDNYRYNHVMKLTTKYTHEELSWRPLEHMREFIGPQEMAKLLDCPLTTLTDNLSRPDYERPEEWRDSWLEARLAEALRGTHEQALADRS